MKKLLLLIIIWQTSFVSCQNAPEQKKEKEITNSIKNIAKMKVEVWSDIMCPFCYIGKRHYEAALAKFPHANQVEIVWRSYQLDPTLPKPASKLNAYEYLAQRKGMSYEQSVAMHKNVIAMAKEAGLNYDYDKAVVANSFDAHRLIQLAKLNNLGDAAEERLFKAYFTEGKDMSDIPTLILLGKEIGLDEKLVTDVLNSNQYTDTVNKDIQEAEQIGVQGVPFFVFNRKYAVSGAQPDSVFLETLNKSFDEWLKANPQTKLEVSEGKVCTPDKGCN
jgi:protein disulfide-isomerase